MTPSSTIRSAAMRSTWAAWAMWLLSPAAPAAEDPDVAQLRNDVRALEREVRELSRRLDQLQAVAPAARGASPPAATGNRLATAPDADIRVWLAPEQWDRLRPGMTAQQVILVLGRPVSMREEGTPPLHTLLYTLEIGDGGFLAGSVLLRDDKVIEVRRPTLR